MKISTIRNLSWMVLANTISSLTKWFIIILIAKQLTVKDVGEYSLAFAVSAPIVLLVQMKLRSIFVTESKINFNNFLYIRKFSSILAILILSSIAILFYKDYFILILIVGLSKLLDLYSDMYYAYPHKKNDLSLIGKLLISKSILLFLLFFIALKISNNLLYSYLFMIIFQVLILIFVEINIIKKKFNIYLETIDNNLIRDILKSAIPLGIVAMIYSFTINVPRYILEYFESSITLGYFSAIMYIVTVSNLFQVAISQVFLPRLSKLYNNNLYSEFKHHLWKKLMLASSIIGLCLIVVIWIFGEQILGLLYGPEYGSYSGILRLAVVAVVINMFSGNIDTALMATRNIKAQPKILIINFFLTLVISMIFIRQFGITGAAYSLIISNSILLLLRLVIYRKKLKVDEAL
ncbi:hypothetical protein CSV69_10070 [Sporosarcina sp. P26b]|uniref:oligosaccharide flippase family protein n=1 Tax=Sporosarcina sp. P26b TaxID=2048253 RepID=UPI000C166C21|nr:oligosaccharide flippase family protein [Sporosarcina sp. P26b]PIC95677.1 hypothetical protein CSV69_10070 [Sporosarcina sp. P26b]